MSYADDATKYHTYLTNVMGPHSGQIYERRQIHTILFKFYPFLKPKKDWIQPSDHCSNHKNKGGCNICGGKPDAIFEYLARNQYKVL